MKLETRRSFTRDIRRIPNRSLLKRIERKIAEMEVADAITELSGAEKLTSPGGNDYRIRTSQRHLSALSVMVM